MDIYSHKWCYRFLNLAYTFASWSKDNSTKVGAYICDSRGQPKSNGYNGFPYGVDDSKPDRLGRPAKYMYTAHAERNALDFAECSVDDCTLYVTHHPCSSCAISIIQRKIKTVVVDKKNTLEGDQEFSERWKEDILVAIEMFNEAGVSLIYFDFDNYQEGV